MALSLGNALSSAGRYLFQQPTSLLRVAKHAAGARLAIPLDAFRWLLAQLPTSDKMPKNVVLTARPPALHLRADVDAMGTPVRAEIGIRIDSLEVGPERARVSIGLQDLKLALLDQSSSSPVAGLLKSGALDLSKPGNLIKMLPKRPAAIVSSSDEQVELDLSRLRSFAHPMVARVLAAVTPVANIVSIHTEEEMLVIGFRITPLGLPATIGAMRG